ncbi:MAG: hypothetical protein LBB60_08260 [Desulfovibrio sp.]|jgi:hypothetical protein|nr:hypothetical protein [Desulfovibrio sp.]
MDGLSIQETGYLLRSPANAERLLESIAALRRGEILERPLADMEDKAMKRERRIIEESYETMQGLHGAGFVNDNVSIHTRFLSAD